MIKKVPYSDNLIQIGNAPVYPGKPVYSDGRVAYGWVYNSSVGQANAIEKGGLWTNTELSTGYYNYRMLNTDGTWGSKYVGNPDIYNKAYAYPWMAEVGNKDYTGLINKSRTQSYTYNGHIVTMDGQGNLLSYYDNGTNQYLLAYESDGSYTATNVSQFFTSTDLWQLTLQDNEINHILTYQGSWQMPTVTGAYVTQREEDPDSPDPQNPEYYWVTYYCGNRLVTPTYETRRTEDPDTGIAYYTTTPNLPTVQLSSQVRLNYSNLDVLVTDEQGHTTRYSNDPLGLLPSTQSETYSPTHPGGVFAYKDILLIQQYNRQNVTGLWKNGHAIQYPADCYRGTSYCFNLAKMRRW